MSARDQRQTFESRAQFEAFDFEQDAPSAWTDTVAAAWSLTRREELSSSAGSAWRTKAEERAKVIGDLGGDADLARFYSTMLQPDWALQLREDDRNNTLDRNPHWINMGEELQRAYRQQLDYERQYPDQVLDDQGLLDAFQTEAAELRKAETFTIERGSGTAAFVGTGAAVMTDPLVLATLPFGAGELAAGRGLLSTIGRTAAVEGSIAVATEVPIQLQVAQFKRELEAPWTWRDSAVNVLAAGLGGAVVGGGLAGTVEGGRQILARFRADREAGRVTPTPATDEAEQALEDTLALHDQNPLEIDGRAVDGVHEAAFERARAQDQAHQPIDVSQTVRPFEPENPVTDVLRRTEDPAELLDIDPTELTVDARTFQFKGGSNAEGVTDALRDVSRFDRRLAGVALIWEDNAGQRFIADGHQRVALAQRAIAAGQDPAEVRLNGFVLREADGITAADARQMAAIKNMAEGSGSALDAAKILREVGTAGEALLPPLPPRSALVRQARGLANLDDEVFMSVVNEVVDARFGALIGQATTDPRLQEAMLQVIKRTEPANETQARSIIEQVKQQGVTVRKTEDLFGESSIAESLYLERAQVLDAALRMAREDKQVFGRLVASEGRIQNTGRNRLDRAANQQRIQEAADATTQITALANTKGELSDALTAAAGRVREGAKPGTVAADVLKAARRAVLEQHRSRRQAGRAQSTGRQKGAQRQVGPKAGETVRLAELSPDEAVATLSAAKQAQPSKTVAQLYKGAQKRQRTLRAALDELVKELGDEIQVLDPGIKARATTEQKMARKAYTDVRELTDINRIGVTTTTPEVAELVLERLASRFGVLDEGVQVTGAGYLDHKALIRYPDGHVAEVQMWDPALAQVKTEGHELYRQIRELEPGVQNAAEIATLETSSRQLYASAIAEASPEWRRVAMMLLPEDMRVRVQALVADGAGSGGAVGKVSMNAARDSSTPDSRISDGVTRDQASAPSATTQPSTPSSGTSRMAPGLDSKLKKRSAIDASPRSIVNKVDNEHSAQPAATKTGTVDDLEYETVMARFDTLADELGEQLTIAREIDGELVTRSARAEIEALDTLEDTLERVRTCSLPGRAA